MDLIFENNDNLAQWFLNFFVCQRKKSVEQNSRHTSQRNLFQLMSSGIADDSENGADVCFYFLEIIISLGNDIRKSRDGSQNGADLQKKKSSSLSTRLVMPPLTYGRGRPLLHGSIFSILAENLYQHKAILKCSRHTSKSSTVHQCAAAHRLGNTDLAYRNRLKVSE